MDARGVLDHRLLLSLLIHDLRDSYDVYVNQLNTGYVTLEVLMKSHRGINVYEYAVLMYRLSLVYEGKEKF